MKPITLNIVAKHLGKRKTKTIACLVEETGLSKVTVWKALKMLRAQRVGRVRESVRGPLSMTFRKE